MKKVLTVLGAAVAGFAAGILAAPKSGKETRADIKKKAGELKTATAKITKKAQSAAKDDAKTVKAGAQKIGDIATGTARTVKADAEKVGDVVAGTARAVKADTEKHFKK